MPRKCFTEIISILFLKIVFVYSYYIEEKHHSGIINNFSFGSCFVGRVSTRFDMFKTILSYKPELWVWLGDAAYADLTTPIDGKMFNYEFSKQVFENSKNNKCILFILFIINIFIDYQEFNSVTPSIGVWDDHDFCINDGNGNFQHKVECKKLYLDYIDEKEDSPRRRTDRGIYATYSFGEKNSYKNFRIILLDVRYNKTSYFFDKNPDILGEDQWQWLEKTLKENDETFTFIGSGSQILPFERLLSESWFYNSRKRLFDLIGKLKKSGVILLSGDIHSAEILRTPCILPNIGYSLYEVTSSGLSHYYRLGFLFDYLLPNKYHLFPLIEYYNFSLLKFDWGNSKEESKVSIEIIDIDDVTRLRLKINYSDLKYNENYKADQECYANINSRLKSLNGYLKYYQQNKEKIIFLLLDFAIILTLIAGIMFILYLKYKFLKLLFRKFIFKFGNDINTKTE